MNEKEKVLGVIKKTPVFPETVQKRLGRDRAVVFSVYLLEKNSIDATFQRICIVASKIFPESFSFPEFPEFPDSRVVRNCLWHCIHKSKEWIIGSDKTKYNLTEKGRGIVDIFQRLIQSNMNVSALPPSLKLKNSKKKDLVTKPLDSELNFINEIKNSKAFHIFLTKKSEIKSIDIKKSLGGDRYSPSSYLRDKLSRAISACDMASDKEVKSYLVWIDKNWASLLED